MARKRILWLVSWYPNRQDPFDGDFIQRHAGAAALHHDIHVIFVKAVAPPASTEKILNQRAGLTEEIIYIKNRKGLTGKLHNQWAWRRAYQSAINDYCSKGLPHWVHVHVPWKAGLMALWMKRKYGVPFLVTEHWGIYNKIADDNIYKKSGIVRQLLKHIYRRSDVFISVSKFLGEAVNETVFKKPYTVIPNVTEATLFFPTGNKNEVFTFLHVSNMVPLKNVGGILTAFHQFLLSAQGPARLLLVGPNFQPWQAMAERLFISRSVLFTGELSHAQVAGHMQASHVLVLNSHIENSPCVIGEALCCGLPVVATAVGGIPELVGHENGILIPSKNPDALCEAMAEIFRTCDRYDAKQIAYKAAAKFSVPVIASQFDKLYGL